MTAAVLDSVSAPARASVAFVLPELLPVPPVQGGAVEYWVDEVSRHMRRSGYEVSVVSRPAGATPLADKAIRYVGVPWTPLASRLLTFKQTTSRRNPLRPLAKIQNVLSYGLKARALLPSAAARIVYVHNDPALTLMLGKSPGQKFVLHMHNDHLASRAMKPLYKRVIDKVDLVLCVSDFIRDSARASFPSQSDKFVTVVNGTDADFFRPTPRPEARAQLADVTFEPGCSYFVYVGRLVEIKGVHVLLEAFSGLLARNPNARLIVAGSSFFSDAPKTSYEARLQEMARPMQHAIVFTGYLPHDKIRLLYAAADAVVVPSTWQEPSGLVLIEAMACGACVIGTRVGGAREIVEDGRTGLMIEPARPDVLQASMQRVIDDPSLRSRLGTAARAEVEQRFTWQRVSSNLDAIFGKL
jgi:spore coat protein SA